MSRTLVDGLQHEWLTSNSRYQAAMIQVKDEDNDAEYALGNQEKWNEAVRASKAQLLSVEKAVGQNIHDLQQERTLIQWILERLETHQLTPAVGLSKVEQSLTNMEDSDTMGDLQSIIASAPKGRGRVHDLPTQMIYRQKTALIYGQQTALLLAEGSPETQDIAKILNEMIADLDKRTMVFESMLANAKRQLNENELKFSQMQGKLSSVSTDIEEARATISVEMVSISLFRKPAACSTASSRCLRCLL